MWHICRHQAPSITYCASEEACFFFLHQLCVRTLFFPYNSKFFYTLQGKLAQLLPVDMQSCKHHLSCTESTLGCTVTVHHSQSLRTTSETQVKLECSARQLEAVERVFLAVIALKLLTLLSAGFCTLRKNGAETLLQPCCLASSTICKHKQMSKL
jgi:hypothetical protein